MSPNLRDSVATEPSPLTIDSEIDYLTLHLAIRVALHASQQQKTEHTRGDGAAYL
jgi:hypothetical protein